MLMSSNLHFDPNCKFNQIVAESYSSLKVYTALPVPQCITYYAGNLGIVTYSGVKVTFSSCLISSFNQINAPKCLGSD